MKKKRSVGVMIFGWLEVFIGTVGGVFFLFSLNLLFSSLYYFDTYIPGVNTVGIDFNVFDLGSLYCFLALPYVVIFFLGIGILLLKPLARKISVFLPLFILIDGCFFIYFFSDKAKKLATFLILFVPLFILSLSAMYFFTRPRIKEQFS